MKPVSLVALAAAALVLAQPRPADAQGGRFRHAASVYADKDGGGLHQPEGVACDGTGQLVVADTGNGRLLRFTYDDRALGGGTEIKVPELSAPSWIQLGSKGDIYALDGKQRRIVQIGPDGAFKRVLSLQGVPPPAAIPKSFKIDAADQFYVLDVFSGRVLVLDADGQFQRAIPLPEDAGFVADLAIDGAGTVLLLDSIKRRIYSAAKDAAAFVPLGGDLTQALSTPPTYMTASKGILFVVDGAGGSIVSIGRDGAFLNRQLTKGRGEGSLHWPSQLCINDKDQAFIADRGNSRVQVFGLLR